MDLERLRETFNKVIDKNIEQDKINEAVNSIDRMNFGELKNLFEGIADKLFETENGKKIIGKYVKSIREDKSLKTLHGLYEKIINPSYSSNPSLLVSSACDMANSLPNHNAYMQKLRETLMEAVIESGISSEEFNNIASKNKDINESIDYIFSNKPNVKNLYERTDKFDAVVKYVTENAKVKANNTNTDGKTPKELTEELNNAFEGLKLWEAEAVKDLSLCYMSDGDGEKLFEEYKTQCIDLLNEKINSCDDLETVNRFQTMREKLEKKTFDEKTLNESILKFAELKNVLINE